MKKFIFSAVALMAFSFAGMANEMEETKFENQLVVNNKIEKVVFVKANCIALAYAIIKIGTENGWDELDILELSGEVRTACEKL